MFSTVKQQKEPGYLFSVTGRTRHLPFDFATAAASPPMTIKVWNLFFP